MKPLNEPRGYDVETGIANIYKDVTGRSDREKEPTETQHEQYEPSSLFAGGGGLPSPDFYGQPKQQWNAEMMDRLLDTRVEVRDSDGNLLPKPKLWLFETDAFRHFQLSNLRSRDQTEMERDIADIQMLANQDGNDTLCEDMQQRVYAKLAMFKSRSDLPIQHRERDAWFTNVTEMKRDEIARPKPGSGGLLDSVFGRH